MAMEERDNPSIVQLESSQMYTLYAIYQRTSLSSSSSLPVRIFLLALVVLSLSHPISCDHNHHEESNTILNESMIVANETTVNQFSTHQNITVTKNDTIPVNIQFKPANYLRDKNYVATNASLNAKAEISDVNFKNQTFEYQWLVKGKDITLDKNANEINYTFSIADEEQFLELHVIQHPSNDTGSIKKDLVIRDPINIQDPAGKLFLERGELLNITLKFSLGTAPINYCYKFCRDVNGKHNPDDCPECKPDTKVDHNQVTIVYYVRNVGNYTLVFVADNIASHVSKGYSVKITDTMKSKTIPFVPIVSSILAVVIVLSGLALHLKFKRSFVTETADFDFIRHDYNEDEDFWDDEEYTFLQRVMYLFFKTDNDHDTSMTDSFVSGTRLRF
uniref:Transmembrane protein 130 n=1 Tax=Aceria tosichella TaxID=561515 RepID=A0A6G1S5E0_9ACAR